MKNLTNFLILVILLFGQVFLSCSQNNITIEDISTIYIKDENGLYSFIVYFPYPKSENFDAAVTIKTQDGKYIWKAPFQDYSVNSNKYKVAGRFHLPESTLNGKEVNVELSYRDVNEIYTIILEYPEEKYTNENIDIFNFDLTRNLGNTSYTAVFKKSISRVDEVIYFYDDKSTLSSPTRISSRINSVKVSNDAKYLTFVQRKSQDKNLYYIKSFDLEDLSNQNL